MPVLKIAAWAAALVGIHRAQTRHIFHAQKEFNAKFRTDWEHVLNKQLSRLIAEDGAGAHTTWSVSLLRQL